MAVFTIWICLRALKATATDASNFAVQRLVNGVVTQQSIVVVSFSCGTVAWGRLTLPSGRLREVMRGLNSLVQGRRAGLSQSGSAAEQ
jgi:hypothetical protein